MGHSRTTWIGVCAAAASLLLPAWPPGSAGAAEDRSTARDDGDVVLLRGSGGDLLAAGRDIALGEAVGGDLAAAGRTVRLSAPVGGYVLAAGREVSIGGAVRDDLWAAGERVTVAAPVGDAARLAGRIVLVQPQAKIGGDAQLAGARVEVHAPVGGDLRVGAAEVVLASEVGGTVHVHAGSLKLAPGAVIHGDLVAYGPQAPEIAPQTRVEGQVRHHPAPSDDATPRALRWLWHWLLGFLALFVLGLAVLLAAPSWGIRVAETIRQRMAAALGAGVIASLVTPVLVLVFAVTIVGIPLAVVVLALYVALLLLSGVFVALRLGGWGLARAGRAQASRYGQLALGALALALVASLPWIGWLAWLFVPLVGLGAILLERRAAWRPQPTSGAQPT